MASDSEFESMACKEFQQRLPKLLESGDELYSDAHLRSCELCRALVIDLEKIADEGRRRFERYN
jgi:hypothetical protein